VALYACTNATAERATQPAWAVCAVNRPPQDALHLHRQHSTAQHLAEVSRAETEGTGMPRTGTHTHTHTSHSVKLKHQAYLGNEVVGTHPLATPHVIPASLPEAAVAISKPTHKTQREECSSTIVLAGAADEQDGLRGWGYSSRYEPWGIGVVLGGTFASALVATVTTVLPACPTCPVAPADSRWRRSTLSQTGFTGTTGVGRGCSVGGIPSVAAACVRCSPCHV